MVRYRRPFGSFIAVAVFMFLFVASPTTNAVPSDGGGGEPGGPVNVPTYFENNILVRAGETIQPLGPNLMGDALNEYSGGLSFNHTDVSIPGNNALGVAVGRRLATGTRQTTLGTGLFGDWDLDIPHLRTTALQSKPDWYGGGPYGAYFNQNRCSQFTTAPIGVYFAGTVSQNNLRPEAWWDGHQMNIPGTGSQTLLSRAGGDSLNPVQPTDGAAYPVLTKQHWQLSCLPSLARGTGEGFVAHAPDGTRYRFDHLVQRAYTGVDVYPYGTVPRIEIWILPTLVTDRFGNWVRYSYGGDDGWRVNSITSSDGRAITFTYNGWGNRIQSVSDGTRTWNYGYDSGGALQTVTLPDSSQWRFDLTGIERDPFTAPDLGCGGGPRYSWDYTTRVGTLTHPSGAQGTFALKMTQHGRSNVPGTDEGCEGPHQENGVNHVNTVSRYFNNYALATKTLAGPGMPAMSWNYAYSAAYGSFGPCPAPAGCIGTKTVTITDPLNNVIQNIYGTAFGINEGLLLTSTAGNGSTTLQTTSNVYRSSVDGPYPSIVGHNAGASDSMSRIHTPQSERTIAQQGVTFSQAITGFDVYARPTSVTRSSSLGHAKTESTTYYDQTNLWVLGQNATRTIAGVAASSTSYNPGTALPTATYRFGKLQATYGFHADGTLASLADGLNQTTTFGNYMRGLPQNIGYADGTSISGVVHNIGVLASTTNEAGSTWSYTYDPMGRLQTKTPPAGDAVAYHPTVLSFAQVPYAEYGLEANHWRQDIVTGQAVTVNYFDARWRKRLTRTFDAANPGATQRFERFDYDPYNRTTYASYPTRSINSVAEYPAGSYSAYDALGRPTRTLADSELGVLTTTTDYLDGFQKRVTNPRGFATTTAYQAFDEPSESAITGITAPEGVSISIHRDVFGKPLAITRGGNGVSATRSYVYDANQLLCKTIEPEIGATIQALDAANNTAWRATGLGLTSTTSCDHASVAAGSKTSFSYDPRNRVTNTSFGDGSPAIGRSYTPDGLLASAISNDSTWTYDYNRRRLLTREDLRFPGGGAWSWTVSRQYDANGNPSAMTYPDTSSIAFSPNALGESTQISGYASGVTYHPNGAVAGYTLANGVVHSLTQNLRGLPLVNSDAGVLQDQYSYDANGNIAAIADSQEGVTTRAMAYDGLDRLTAANAPNVWGAASYGYDALDNLRTSTVGARNSAHSYDANNRLSSISTNGIDTTYGYDPQGNITGRGAQGFHFDQGNRLQHSNGVASYTYDGHGRRMMTQGADGSTQWSAYGLDGKLRITQTTRGGGSYTLYFYLGDKLIAENNNVTGIAYKHTDALGSPVATVASAPAEVSYSCPAGWSLSGSTCSQATSSTMPAVVTGYNCPADYTLAGTTCIQSTSTTSPATVSYGCPAGWSLSGTTCSTSSASPAAPVYACPGGWSLSGSTCSGTATAAASVSLSCNGHGSPQAYAASPTGHRCLTQNIRTKLNPDAYEQCQSFAASLGLPLVATPVSNGVMQCVSGPVRVYACPAGATLSGTNCISAVSQQASIGGYTCGSGTLSGSSCVTSASTAASASYSCPAGQSLAGQSCTLSGTVTTAGTPSYACPAGATLAGDTCTTQGTASQGATATFSCPTGGTLSGSTCAGIVTRTRYEPYGNTAAGKVPNGIGFTGHVNDADTGLVYMQQRYYDSLAGRFLSVDPVVTDTTTGYGFGRYHYAENNPYRYTDPDGRQTVCGGSTGVDCGPILRDLAADQKKNNRHAWNRAVAAGDIEGMQEAFDEYADMPDASPMKMVARSSVLMRALSDAGRGGGGGGVLAAGAAGGFQLGMAGFAGKWTLGEGKSASRWAGQMERRGWTSSQIDEAIASGKKFPAPNNLNPGNGATRFEHPQTGRSLVIDNKTGQVIHVGGNGFKY